jgi:hypothetical protein
MNRGVTRVTGIGGLFFEAEEQKSYTRGMRSTWAIRRETQVDLRHLTAMYTIHHEADTALYG